MDVDGLRRAGAFLQQLVLPDECCGCGRVGPSLCDVCRTALTPQPVERRVGDLIVTSALVYDAVVQRVVVAMKNEGRTACGGPLAAALRSAVDQARFGRDGLLLVPMPTTGRSSIERGYDPVHLLLRRAGLARRDLLRTVRRPADQIRLDRAARLANVAGTMRARGDLHAAQVLLIDDVVTTGATLTEAARAVRAAGGRVVGAATVAATPRRADRARTP